ESVRNTQLSLLLRLPGALGPARRQIVELALNLLRLARELLDETELLLELLLVALQRAELGRLRLEHAKELLDLNLLREGDAAKLLDVALSPKVHAITLRSIAALSIPSCVSS